MLFRSAKVAQKFRSKTYASGKRPFGVGLLLVGFDLDQVPHVYELGPGGDCIEYEAYAIGANLNLLKLILKIILILSKIVLIKT